MREPDSVRRPDMPAPLHHPYYEPPRVAQRRAFEDEVAAFIAARALQRAWLATRRVLPVVS